MSFEIKLPLAQIADNYNEDETDPDEEETEEEIMTPAEEEEFDESEPE